MFARNVSIHLKSNMFSDYTRTFENDTLPLFHQQKGFKDENVAGGGGRDENAAALRLRSSKCLSCALSLS